METKWTPGPWKAAVGDDPEDPGFNIWVVGCANKDTGVHGICSMDGPADWNRANARLIAAAPELYEALRALRDSFLFAEDDGQIGVSSEVDGDLFNAACRALAKARGESND